MLSSTKLVGSWCSWLVDVLHGCSESRALHGRLRGHRTLLPHGAVRAAGGLPLQRSSPLLHSHASSVDHRDCHRTDGSPPRQPSERAAACQGASCHGACSICGVFCPPFPFAGAQKDQMNVCMIRTFAPCPLVLHHSCHASRLLRVYVANDIACPPSRGARFLCNNRVRDFPFQPSTHSS